MENLAKNGKPGGPKATVAALAAAKKLPVDHLQKLGLRDTARGVAIPYYGVTGGEIAVKTRTALVAKEGSRWPKDVQLAAYGSWKISEAVERGYLVLVEGESDCWALWHYDLPALGVPGANAAKVIEAEHIEAVESIYIHVEPDLGGERFLAGVRARLAALKFRGEVRTLRMPNGAKDPADLHAADPDKFLMLWQRACNTATPLTLVQQPGPQAAEGDKKGGRPAQAEQLIELAAGASYFHTPDGEPFARVPVGGHLETWPVRSKGFRRWLVRRFYEACQKSPTSQALQDALGVLESKAVYDGPEMPVYTRIGEHEGAIYLDLCNRDWQAVKITPRGWEIDNRPPILFRRSKGMRPLPEPARGGRIDELRPFVNVADDDNWRLLVAWLVAAFRPRGPYPLLCLHGEQGSAKSTTARALRSLIDPNTAPLRSEPREARDLMIAATNAWLVAFDNLSSIPTWLSDALCRLATGGGFSTRELYTDGDEILFDAMRPCLLTSIEDLAVRGDLLERAIILTLPGIPDDRRRTEEEYDRDLDAARPRILGALLDAVAAAMANLPNVRLDRLPRMADFARWVCAAEPTLGWPAGAFVRSYRGNQQDANELALEASVVVGPLRQLLDRQPAWIGTAGELLDALGELAGDAAKRKEWPSKGHVLSGQLRRLAPNLRKAGVTIRFQRDKHTRTIALEKVRETASPASPASSTSKNTDESQSPGDAGDAPGDADDAVGDAPSIRETSGKSWAGDAGDARDALPAGFSGESLPEDWRAVWAERAAIMQYDGGLPRERAEAEALAEVLAERKRAA